jgi:hypothetical protein
VANKYSSNIRSILLAAGWFEGRSIPLPAKLLRQSQIFATAQEVLVEMSGLHFGECGEGIDVGKCDVMIDFSFCSRRNLSPVAISYEATLETKFCLVGKAMEGYLDLLIDEQGRTYTYSGINGKLHFLATTFAEGLEMLLLGKESRNERVL